MATDLVGSFGSIVDLAYKSTGLDLNVIPSAALRPEGAAIVLASGENADALWFDRRTLAGSGTETFDLSGSFSDVYGTSFILDAVFGIFVQHRGEVGTNDTLTFGPAAAAGWNTLLADDVTLQAGAVFSAVAPSDGAGWAVSVGVADVLTFTNDDATNSVDYDIIIAGAFT